MPRNTHYLEATWPLHIKPHHALLQIKQIAMDTIERILLDIIKGFVDFPDQVELHKTDDVDEQGELVVVNVKLAREDVGMCIGQKGSTAEALRKIVGLIAFKQLGKRVYVKIDAPRIPRSHFGYDEAAKTA